MRKQEKKKEITETGSGNRWIVGSKSTWDPGSPIVKKSNVKMVNRSNLMVNTKEFFTSNVEKNL